MNSGHAVKLRFAPLALLAVSAAWGMAFVVMKDPIEKQNVNSFLFTRFFFAVVAMLAFQPSVRHRFTRELVQKGFIAGIFLGAGYILQTLGLARTGAAITGFITGLYVVATPVLAALILKVRFPDSPGLVYSSQHWDWRCFHSRAGTLGSENF